MKAGHVHAGFDQWLVFEKLRAANRMRHREVYEAIEQRLAAGFEKPPRILDIGCGDARDIAQILKRVPAATYTGIDNDSETLDLARTHLSDLPCPLKMIHGDYVACFEMAEASFDVIWVGLFFHHLPTEQKQGFFHEAARMLPAGGTLLAHDPVLRETEDREGFLDRIAQASRGWPELSDEEREVLGRHWSRHGHQERVSRLHEMAEQAGFSITETLWRDPDGFYVVLAFRR